MVYNHKEWKNRYAERTDLSIGLVHFTREVKNISIAQLMFDILNSRILKGSSTGSGFIVGKNTAVCFQESPLISICQNSWYEQKMNEKNKLSKIRYSPCGFMFHKFLIYRKGGRPVIYDKTLDAKKYLPEEQWWRIVNFDEIVKSQKHITY